MLARKVMSWIRFAFSSPWSLVSWLWVVINCFVLWTADYKTLKFAGSGILTAEWRTWFSKRYKYSTTVGRSILFHPSHRKTGEPMDERLEKHERIHVWQVEDLMFLSFSVGLGVAIHTGDLKLGFMLWLSGGLWQLPNFVTALLRFGHTIKYPKGPGRLKNFFKFFHLLFMEIAYRDSLHERSAYAQTDVYSNGSSWYDDREKARSRALAGHKSSDQRGAI